MYSLKKADGAYPLYGFADNDPNQPVDGGITTLRFGMRWEPKNPERKGAFGWAERKKREMEGKTDPADWDAGAVFLTGGDPKKYIGFDNFEPFKDEATPEERNSARHSGDSVRGAGDGDDEQIDLDLPHIPKRYDSILLIGGAAKLGSAIDAVRDVKATIYDGTGGQFQAMGEYEPSLLRAARMIAMARVDRDPVSKLWKLSIVGESFNVTPGDFRTVLQGALNVTSVRS
jgi:stress response protein SCP2